MRRHTITLAMIVKNEVNNLPRLLASTDGCFDEYVFVDTGSTDGTIEYLTDLQTKGMKDGAKVTLRHFEWCDDFSAARNESYKDIKTDFVMWMDADDELSDKESFIKWRNVAMPLADYWMATYHYAYEANRPVISFLRERVIRVSKKPTWQYFIHEGIPPSADVTMQAIQSWQICHRRSVQDMSKDKGRNLRIFKKKIEEGVKLNARMQFYYGKELFENGDHLNAWKELKEAISRSDLERGDRILALQYFANACLVLNNPQSLAEAKHFSHLGLELDPTRSEFWCILGDIHLSQRQFGEAKSYYLTAMNMPNRAPAVGTRHEFIHHIDACHNIYPIKQISKVLFNMGDFKEALSYIERGLEKFSSDKELPIMKQDCLKAIAETSRDKSKIVDVDEIVISTPPMNAYEWDDKIYTEKGVGGSETAAIEMAKWIRRLTNKKVIIFNMRKEPYVSPEGVEYRSVTELNRYFNSFRPSLHIAWRHNIKVTDAPTYLWCHDLITMGAEEQSHYDAILCLSQFHKEYIQSIQSIPSDKLILTRNGINLDRFADIGISKNENKIVFPSSPDRGLARAIKIVERARILSGKPLELHVYYGFDNLKKYGLTDLALELEQEVSSKPWIKYHGNVEQKQLAREMQEAVVWLYPASFIESFCITALESLAARCFPLVRNIGALPNTLHEASSKGQALVLDCDAESAEDIEYWAMQLRNVIDNKAWKAIDLDMSKYSWESVAREWCQLFGLEIVNDEGSSDDWESTNVRELPKPRAGYYTGNLDALEG